MMTSKLSFTIHGSKKSVSAKARLFMHTMSDLIGKKTDGAMVVEVNRQDSRETFKQIKARQSKEMFPNAGPANGGGSVFGDDED